MAVRLIANYSKRLGLPGYSSHQFSVSVETELRDVQDVEGESQRLYQLLQQNVDAQIQDTGFVPEAGDEFEFITWDTSAGDFAEISGLKISDTSFFVPIKSEFLRTLRATRR